MGLAATHARPDPSVMTDTEAQRASRDNRYSCPAAQWWTPTRGVRLPIGHTSVGERADALLLACPNSAVLVGPTAGSLKDMPLPLRVEEGHLHVNLPSEGFHVERPNVVCHRMVLPETDIERQSGRPVTTPTRTLLDLGAYLDTAELVAVADDILRRGLATLPDLVARATQHRRRRGIVRVREALEYADPRAESPRESVMRFHLWRAGLRGLVPNQNVYDRQGRFIARGDLVDHEARIIIEYDGVHHLTRETQANDAERRLRLAVDHWFMVTVVPRDLQPPSRLMAKVFAAYDAVRSRTTLR